MALPKAKKPPHSASDLLIRVREDRNIEQLTTVRFGAYGTAIQELATDKQTRDLGSVIRLSVRRRDYQTRARGR